MVCAETLVWQSNGIANIRTGSVDRSNEFSETCQTALPRINIGLGGAASVMQAARREHQAGLEARLLLVVLSL